MNCTHLFITIHCQCSFRGRNEKFPIFKSLQGFEPGLHREEASGRVSRHHELAGPVKGVRKIRHSGNLPFHTSAMRLANEEAEKGERIKKERKRKLEKEEIRTKNR